MIIGRYIIIIYAAILTFSSCKKKDITTDPQNSQFDEAYSILSQVYYWNEDLVNQHAFNLSSVSSLQELMSEIRNYSPLNETTGERIDRWSFSLPETEWNNILTGVKNDVGVSLRIIGEDEIRISMVQPMSPAALSGLRRGMKVHKLNGVDATLTNLGLLVTELNNASSLHFQVQNATSLLDFKFKRSAYQAADVLMDSIYYINDKKIGYLVYNSFTNNAGTELKQIVQKFSTLAQINELIVDLRYNGGGLVSAMEDFANLLAPANAKNQVMYSDRHNKAYSIFDSKTFFDGTQSALNLQRIVFIIGKNTASASELLINTLKPYLNVVTIGQTSDGKPYGMYIFKVNDQILSPVSFESFNADGKSSSYLGIKPDITSYESINEDFGETEEVCLKDALDYITNGVTISSNRQSFGKTSFDKNLPISTNLIGAFKTFDVNIKNKN